MPMPWGGSRDSEKHRCRGRTPLHRVSQYPPRNSSPPSQEQFAGARVDAGGLEDHAVAVEGGGEGRADRVDHRSRGVKWTWQAAGELGHGGSIRVW